jgi:hypothetical protein
MAYWYTGAWFDKYLKDDPTADQQLLTRRWLDDPKGGNMLSWHFRSRIDIHTATGQKAECEDLRSGCSVMVPKASDGWSGEYDFIQAAARNK